MIDAPSAAEWGDEVSSGAAVDIELVATATRDARELIGELDQVLAAEYLPEQRHGLALEALFQPHIRFFVARLNGAAIGCGGMALFDDFAEVKRMYVRETVRGRGAGLVDADRNRGSRRRICRLAPGNRRTADGGTAVLCPDRLQALRCIRRLRPDAAGSYRDQHLHGKAAEPACGLMCDVGRRAGRTQYLMRPLCRQDRNQFGASADSGWPTVCPIIPAI
jgi:putative acetyltransferase